MKGVRARREKVNGYGKGIKCVYANCEKRVRISQKNKKQNKSKNLENYHSQ